MRKVVFVVFFLLSTFIVVAQDVQSDEQQIRELINKFSIMWTEPNGVRIAEETASENFVYIINKRSFNKKQYLELLSGILKGNLPQKHTHQVYDIVINENLAYEYGLIEMVMKNGNSQKTESLNVFIKENGVWKLLSNLPVEMMKSIFSK